MPTTALDLSQYPVLLVDDEPNVIRTLRFNFEREFALHTSTNPTEALALIDREPIAVLVTDQRMPQMTGLELIEAAMRRRPGLVPILLTGYTDVEVLTRAINMGGIRRYIGKPFDPRELRSAILHAIEAVHLERTNARLTDENARLVQELQRANDRLSVENRYLRQRDGADKGFDALIGRSAAMTRVLDLARKLADSPTTVLIEGPSGTGKELVARAIHYDGNRRQRLFVACNAGAIPESLLASTLFGHRRGAFTGASADAKGLFEMAHGGTLFLDEIGDATPPMQGLLLRVLQDGEILPVGASRPIYVDVRVVAATNRDLDGDVRAGRFREDLWHRLRAFRLRLPSLAERPEDVPLLALHLVGRVARRLGKRVEGLTPEAMTALMRRAYVGNVRELENVIERAVVLCAPGAPVTEADLLDPFGETCFAVADEASTLQDTVAAFEREQIVQTVQRCGGNKSQAARVLGLTYRGLLFKLQRHGLMPVRDVDAVKKSS